jgi:hypothetical protein
MIFLHGRDYFIELHRYGNLPVKIYTYIYKRKTERKKKLLKLVYGHNNQWNNNPNKK